MLFDDAVIDTGTSTATPQFLSSSGNLADYDVPGNGGVNEWQQNFDDPWFATADLQFVGGQASVPLQILNDSVADGNDTIVWKISDSDPFGFSQQTWVVVKNEQLKAI